MAELLTLIDTTVLASGDGSEYPDLFPDGQAYYADLVGYQNVSTVYIEVSGTYQGGSIVWDNDPGGFQVYAVDSEGSEEYLGEVLFNYPGEMTIQFGLDPPFQDTNKFLRVYIAYSPDGEGQVNDLTWELFQITADPLTPPGAVCFWTDFNKSYEICEGRGGSGGVFTPEWSPTSDWPAIDDPTDSLRIFETLDEIYGNSLSEPAQYGYNYFTGDGFGDPETILFVAKIPGIGGATDVTWAYNKVSGFDRTFAVNQIIGEYVVFDIQFNYGVDGFNAEHASVYEFVGTADGTELPALTLNFVVYSGLF